MAKYILVKKVKGKKYEYQVIDADSKAIVSKRTSAREYVACTADGSFYFGRLDLIGKGDHGKRLSHATEILANPERVALNNARRECWTDCPEPERYPLSYDGADFDQWGDCEFGIHD